MISISENEDKSYALFKVFRKFLKPITKALDGISGITKNIFFFHLKACERRNFDFCVFLQMYWYRGPDKLGTWN